MVIPMPPIVHRAVFACLVLGVVVACDSGRAPETETAASKASSKGAAAAPAPAKSEGQSAPDSPPASPSGPEHFGAAFTLSEPSDLATVLARPTEFKSKPVLVEGLVRRACSRKGCWMELTPSESAPGCRVTFKDYGFFVPKDSAGSRARIEARVETSELSARDVRHYENEGAQFPNKTPEGTVLETRLVATAVSLSRP